MPGNLQALRRRIRSVSSTKKITKAQELVASSRIAKAQERVEAARPYASTMTTVLAALAANATLDHPLLVERATVRRTGILLITSDRGLCGGYNANAIRMAESVVEQVRSEGKEPVLYVVGRKGIGYYSFRGRAIQQSWSGFSERPGVAEAQEIGQVLVEAFLAGSDRPGPGGVPGVDEVYLVDTRFKSLMTQIPRSARLAPLPVDGLTAATSEGPAAAYAFEPEADQLLEALLPKYISTRVYVALLDSAASESAARRRAMKSATDNADELLTAYTRQMNSARQAAITQEISEIVGGANALAAAGSDM